MTHIPLKIKQFQGTPNRKLGLSNTYIVGFFTPSPFEINLLGRGEMTMAVPLPTKDVSISTLWYSKMSRLFVTN